MQIEHWEIDRLIPYEKNPRKNDEHVEKFAEAIKAHGFRVPVLAKSDGQVIDGHFRLKAAKLAGLEAVPVIPCDDMSEVEIKAFRISVNACADLADWDFDLLKVELEELKDLDFDLDSIGLDGDFMKDLLNSIEETEGLTDPDAVPDLPEEPVTKPGDLYQLGHHRLLCGDSTVITDVEWLMDGKRASMVFTDPPYNVDYGNTAKDKMRGKAGKQPGRKILNDKFKTNEEFYQFLYDCISAMRPFVAGDVYICMSSSELHTLQKAFIDCDGHWSTFIIWVKNTFTLGRANYQRQYEPILYGWFEGTSHYWSGVRNLSDVYRDEVECNVDGQPLIKMAPGGIESDIWEHPKPQKNVEHPTMKPVALCERGVRNSSKNGSMVYDPFLGSGSTLIACEHSGRICYGIELDPKYCDVIVKRWEDFTGKKAELIKR